MSAQALEKKQAAAQYFTQKLLQSEVGGDINRIVLFGSVARGDADDYSDIDVLLFAKSPEKVREVLWQVNMDAYEKYRESIEPMVYPAREHLDSDSYFLRQSVRAGRQLYP